MQIFFKKNDENSAVSGFSPTAETVGSKNLAGLRRGGCKIVVRALPPGTGIKVRDFDSFKELKEYRPNPSYAHIKKVGGDIYEGSFSIASGTKDVYHGFEIITPRSEGNVCIGDDSQIRIDYIYQNNQELPADFEYKFSLKDYDFSTGYKKIENVISKDSKAGLLEGRNEFFIEGENADKSIKDYLTEGIDKKYVTGKLSYKVKDSEALTRTVYVRYDKRCRGLTEIHKIPSYSGAAQVTSGIVTREEEPKEIVRRETETSDFKKGLPQT